MENKGLIFIPDISGFTRFVNEMEIEHSRLIIEELLEVIINANQLGLEISEIEGDAILFYKYGDAPALPELYRQVEKMFTAFHRHLMVYDHRRLCFCSACKSAIDLTLKVVTHYGEFTGYMVKNFSKLIGRDIIVAHQLLKNDIDQHEYWLLTPSLSGGRIPDNLPARLDWNESSKETESGTVSFQYAQLSHLRDQIPPDAPLELEVKNRKKVIAVSRVYDVSILTLLHAAVDFPNRKRWQEGVDDIRGVNPAALPRLGRSHERVGPTGITKVFASSYSFAEDRIQYGETDELKHQTTYLLFEKMDENKTKLTIEIYLQKNLLPLLVFNITKKKKLERSLLRSLEKLEEIGREYSVLKH